MAWIEVHQSLRDHRKLFALADELKVQPVHAIGHLVSLWLWAVDNAPSGDLTGVPPRTIARASYWRASPSKLVDGLQKSGWLNGLQLHDWQDYAGKLIQAREKDKLRHRKSEGTPRELRGNSEATVQYSTVPNSTISTPLPPPGAAAEKVEEIKKEVTIPEKEGATTEAEFQEYVGQTKREFSDLDCEVEFKKFTLYWSEGSRRLKRPKTAWFNWLTKAREFKGGGNGSGTSPAKLRPGKLAEIYTGSNPDPEGW